jgi:Gas vesicle synthesis protein GvpL/GvpF
VIVLHAVVPRDTDEIGDQRLRAYDAGPVKVLYEETDEAPVGERADVIEHGRRIVALADRVPTLPMRYGTTLADVEELSTVGKEHADAWARRLARLVDRCELVVHLETSSAAGADPVVDSGRAYLRLRMARLRRQDLAIDEARKLLGRWVEETRVLPDRERLAVLLRRRDVDPARHVLEAWGRSRDDLSVTLTGPWPPFSFCEEGDVP